MCFGMLYRHHEYIQLNKFSELRVLTNQESRRKYQNLCIFVDLLD